MNVRVSTAAIIVGLLQTSVAFGQDPAATDPAAGEGMADPAAEEAAAEPPPVEEPAPVAEETAAPAEAAPAAASGKPNSAAGDDGVRFRFGVSGGAGIIASDFGTWGYGGVDLRFGAQVTDMIAIYAQPTLGGYGGTSNGFTGGGGLIGISALAEATLVDRFFVGAGGGFGILNNPSGPELHFRLGAYPLMSRSGEKIRRKGLMLGADLRLHFLSDASGTYTFIAPTFNIGYEAF